MLGHEAKVGWCWVGAGLHTKKGRVGRAGWLKGNLRIQPMADIKNREVFLIFESFTNCKSI
jgi:hypothetical protein